MSCLMHVRNIAYVKIHVCHIGIHFESLSITNYGDLAPACVSTCTIVCRNYTPLLCMLALGKQGRGLIRRIVIFTCDDHYRPTNTTWARDLYTFSGSLMGKTQEKQQRHNLTQIANVLAVATVFIGLWTLLSIIDGQRRGGGLITRDKNTYAGT